MTDLARSPRGRSGDEELEVGLRTAARSHSGLVRAENQDAFGGWSDSAPRALLLVADGLGGHRGGQTASWLAVDAFEAVFLEAEGKPSDELLVEALEHANRAIYERSRLDRELAGMGTTAVSLVLDLRSEGSSGWLAHVGDSRCYRSRGGGLECLTLDHTLRAQMRELGAATTVELDTVPGADALMRALGPEPEVEVEVVHVSVEPGDRFLLCSDGLWNVVPDSDTADILARHEPPDAVELLIDEALRRGAPDNVTALIACVSPAARVEPSSALERVPTEPAVVARSSIAAIKPASLGTDRVFSAPLADVGAADRSSPVVRRRVPRPRPPWLPRWSLWAVPLCLASLTLAALFATSRGDAIDLSHSLRGEVPAQSASLDSEAADSESGESTRSGDEDAADRLDASLRQLRADTVTRPSESMRRNGRSATSLPSPERSREMRREIDSGRAVFPLFLSALRECDLATLAEVTEPAVRAELSLRCANGAALEAAEEDPSSWRWLAEGRVRVDFIESVAGQRAMSRAVLEQRSREGVARWNVVAIQPLEASD